MRLDVTQLLTEPVGTTQQHSLSADRAFVRKDPGERYWGDVSLLRTDKGVLVSADLQAEVVLECSRCLVAFREELTVRFDEEFVAAGHVSEETGEEAVEPAHVSTIEDDQVLDLEEVLRQETLVQTPMQPFCKPDCAGLCPQCGADLRSGACRCEADAKDARWVALEALTPSGHAKLEGN